jgi:non-heme chloroperoxidase
MVRLQRIAENMLSMEVNGQRLTYIDRGSGEAVVFVHGNGMDYRVWDSQIEPFSRKYRVIAYSRRYAYPNQKVGDHTDDNVSNNAEDLAEFIDRLNVWPVHLIGHSFGAFTALYCTVHNRELIRTLVLAEPSIVPLLAGMPQSPSVATSLENFSETMKSVKEAAKTGDNMKAATLFFNFLSSKKNALEQAPAAIRIMIMDNAESLKGIGGYAPFECDEVRHLHNPTLLIKGEISQEFFHAITDILSKCLPTVEVISLPPASHLLQTEQPEQFNTKVLEFLKRHS